jgi:hypothetical protein
MRRALLLVWIVCIVMPSAVAAQTAPPPPADQGGRVVDRASSQDVRPFLSWFEDAAVFRGAGIEPYFRLGDSDGADLYRFGVQGGVEAAEDFEVGGALDVRHLSLDGPFDDQTGLSDLRAYARYRIPGQQRARFSVGAWVDLPVGNEDVGEGNFDVDLFGAMRLPTRSGLVVLANAGIESVERFEDRDTGVHLGGGALYPLSRDISVLGELLWRSASEYGALSAGLDASLGSSGHLRAALAFGFDDGAPDLELILGFLIPIY